MINAYTKHFSRIKREDIHRAEKLVKIHDILLDDESSILKPTTRRFCSFSGNDNNSL